MVSSSSSITIISFAFSILLSVLLGFELMFIIDVVGMLIAPIILSLEYLPILHLFFNAPFFAISSARSFHTSPLCPFTCSNTILRLFRN
jgi:hypothetical protein